MLGRRGKYSTVEGEVTTKEERRIVPMPGLTNNKLYDIGRDHWISLLYYK